MSERDRPEGPPGQDAGGRAPTPPDRPAGIRSFESAVEQTIREAIEAGEFDRLAGHGQPLADLDRPHDELWWVKRKLRDEGFTPPLPEALSLRGEVERSLDRLERVVSETEARAVLEALNDKIRKVNATTWTGPASNLAPLDVEATLGRWRATRDRRSPLTSP